MGKRALLPRATERHGKGVRFLKAFLARCETVWAGARACPMPPTATERNEREVPKGVSKCAPRGLPVVHARRFLRYRGLRRHAGEVRRCGVVPRWRVVRCGAAVACGAVWRRGGVVWCGVVPRWRVWCGVVRCGVVWCGAVSCAACCEVL